jgi:O-acetyl-ADP-ribose deacetylase (regulator of RNase III)
MPDEPSDKGNETTDGAELSLFGMALWGPDGPPERIFGRHDWGLCSDYDRHPDECEGHTSAIREPVPIPPPNMLLSRDEMQAIALGYRPVDMSDKWLAFMENDRLFLHRSWTGHGIYEVRFAAKGLSWSNETGFMPTSARVESDPRRYNPEELDPIAERDFLRDLIIHVSGEPMPISLPIVLSTGPTLQAVLGDITDEDVDAIVNPANTRLAGGNGVNGAIHHAAGPELLAHCKTLKGCPVGRAKVTPGYRLDARWVIHTVGPQWRGGTQGEPVLLESCYRESLARADEVDAQSVAFPALATGAHGYPLKAAARIAVDTVRSTSTDVNTIRFVCFDRPTLRAFQSAIDGDG